MQKATSFQRSTEGLKKSTAALISMAASISKGIKVGKKLFYHEVGGEVNAQV